MLLVDLCRMDEMMRGQRGWRELAVLGDKINKFTGMIEGLIWSPRSSEGNDQADDWAFEEVSAGIIKLIRVIYLYLEQILICLISLYCILI